MDRLLNVIAILSVLLAVLVLASLRRAHIRVEYSVSWLAAALGLLALSRSKSVVLEIAAGLGMPDHPAALLLIVGCVFLFIFYRFTVIISKLRDDNTALAQRVAILEFRVQSKEAAE
jgi:hypothetical protein